MTWKTAETNIRDQLGVADSIDPTFLADQIALIGESINHTRSTVLQAKWTGNTLSGFTNGDFQRVDLTGGVLNPSVENYTASMPNRDINDLINITLNTIKTNPEVGTGVDFRVIFDFNNKETTKDYVAVWKFKLPTDAPITFEQNLTVSLKKKDSFELSIPFNLFTVSTVNNIDYGFELYVAIQKKDESDTGDTTATEISLTNLNATHFATAV